MDSRAAEWPAAGKLTLAPRMGSRALPPALQEAHPASERQQDEREAHCEHPPTLRIPGGEPPRPREEGAQDSFRSDRIAGVRARGVPRHSGRRSVGDAGTCAWAIQRFDH
jgi:hypothetical protein